ncbi:MAG: putative toxin-antitoxin system toxin component, PIN family [Archaeoglobaceae archaeon]
MGKKTRVVLDTNIWISIFFSKILAKEFEELLKDDKIEIFTSSEILKEISRVLEYPEIKKIMKSSGIDSKDFVEEILKVSVVVNPRRNLT